MSSDSGTRERSERGSSVRESAPDADAWRCNLETDQGGGAVSSERGLYDRYVVTAACANAAASVSSRGWIFCR